MDDLRTFLAVLILFNAGVVILYLLSQLFKSISKKKQKPSTKPSATKKESGAND